MYGCVGCLHPLYERLSRTLDEHGISWEAIFVEDGSPDESWLELEALASRDPRICALGLSRNFGQHAAITAGLAESRGRWVAVMDCDLQDPPEEIPGLLATARQGYEIVLTKRSGTRQRWFRRLGATVYLRLRNALMKTRVDPGFATLSVLARPVVDAFLRIGDRDRQYMLLVHWLGFRRTVKPLPVAERHAGRSSYTLSKLIRVALDGMFFQTTVLLQWIVYLGFVIALAGAALAAALVGLFFFGRPPPGYTSLAVLILLVGGFIIMSTGVMGLYVGKIFEQVKGRPLYVVGRRIGSSREEADEALERVPTEPIGRV